MISIVGEKPMYFENFDLETVVTPVNADKLEELLKITQYDINETEFIVNGFRNGFDIGYRGPLEVQRTSPNLRFRIGNEVVLWNKIMKEVKLKRYAGPFSVIPYDNYVQSPVGLVPKNGGKDTRLIFHLSYPRNGESINSCTPKHLCKVRYCDFADAIRLCMRQGARWAGKSDMLSAFRNLGILKKQWFLLLLKAVSPFDGNTYWFLDKCLPFGAAVSCSHFQKVSNCIAHLAKVRSMGNSPVNYLDDYLFVAYFKHWCNRQIQNFLEVCSDINFPVSMDKTFWAEETILFLGLLIDLVRQLVSIPADKVERAKTLIMDMLSSKKTTVHQLQKLAGYLNFLCRCVIPGRAFTRRIYTFYSPKMLPHHHVNVTKALKDDLRMWNTFLNDPSVYCRPFIDFSLVLKADMLDWYTDASGVIGFGGYHLSNWFQGRWSNQFLETEKPSIQYQELYAVTVSVLLWGERYRNKRICLFCDNLSVVNMINATTTGCKNCMVLIRILVLRSMMWNLRIFARHVETKDNFLADALSRFQMGRFWKDVHRTKRTMQACSETIPHEIWPVDKVWLQ